MSRLTPFDHAFADLADRRFPEIREEAQAAAKDVSDPAQFATLPSAARLLGELESPDPLEREPEATEAYLAALHIAYRFWEAGRPVLALDRCALDTALESAPPSAPAIPHGTCYVRFPERWFWAQVDPDRPHEPLDGLYLTTTNGGRELTVFAVLGLRADRPGFSQLVASAPLRDLHAARAEARTPPFAPVVEGGVAASLRSIVTTGELLYLAEVALAATSGARSVSC